MIDIKSNSNLTDRQSSFVINYRIH